jgi:hypothetical protein
MDGQTKETRETQETRETKARSRTMVDSDFSSVSVVSSVPKCLKKKVYTRYVIVENNNIYISDIIISIIYTTLITHGSEIRRGRKSVHSFIFIGKMNE